MQHADEIGDNLVVAADVHNRADIIGVAAETGKVLAEADKNAVGRMLVVVERVVGQSVPAIDVR